MKRVRELADRAREKGQSMVEVALFFPIFVVLLAGLAEVSQIVIDQNRVSNASRTGTRFMANGGDNSGMVRVSLNAITQTLQEDQRRWDIWAIRGTVNAAGDGFSEWEFEHVYGISNTQRFGQVSEPQVQTDVLRELQTGGLGATADLRIVGTYMLHDFDAIIDLNAIPWLAGINSVRALNVMRITGFTNEASQACDAFPIAINEQIRSVTPPGTGSNPFPGPHDFHPGSPTPVYSDFPNHVPDIPLVDAKEGYVFRVQNGFGQGNFGWLLWNEGRPGDANTLLRSLTWPGDSKNYGHAPNGSGLSGLTDCHGPPCPPDGRVYGYVEAGDVTDTSMHIGDWVAANTGNVNSNQNRRMLDQHITLGRELRMIVYEQSQQVGSNGLYQIKRFAVFKIAGYSLRSNNSWILAEFIRFTDDCGEVN